MPEENDQTQQRPDEGSGEESTQPTTEPRGNQEADREEVDRGVEKLDRIAGN